MLKVQSPYGLDFDGPTKINGSWAYTAAPTDGFWKAWHQQKAAFKRHSYSVTKSGGDWQVRYWSSDPKVVRFPAPVDTGYHEVDRAHKKAIHDHRQWKARKRKWQKAKERETWKQKRPLAAKLRRQLKDLKADYRGPADHFLAASFNEAIRDAGGIESALRDGRKPNGSARSLRGLLKTMARDVVDDEDLRESRDLLNCIMERVRSWQEWQLTEEL